MSFDILNKLTKWKFARVMPVFKNDDKIIPGNYRPISLLSCVGKVMERATFKYIFHHIKNLIHEF